MVLYKDMRINGIDVSPFTTKYGYSVKYPKRKGRAGGMMLDGSQTVDILAIKAQVSVPTIPMPEETLSLLISSIDSADYVQLYYYDPKIMDYREIETIANDTSASYLMRNAYGDDIWKTDMLVMEER